MEQTVFGIQNFALDDEQSLRFELFKAQSDEHGLLQQLTTSSDDVGCGLNDDAALLRFLIGRSFDVNGALKQYEATSDIRTSIDAGKSYDDIEISEFEDTRHLYPHWSGCRDKSGLPLCMFDLSHLNDNAISRYCASKKSSTKAEPGRGNNAVRQAVVFHDYLTRFVLPLCSVACDRPDTQRPVTSAVYLVDVSSLTLKQGWSVRSYAQDISKLLATCYPEVVERVLNAPGLFGKVWGILSRWVDPRTASKLVIVPCSETLETLCQYIDVESIPTQFGGKFEFEHGMTPKLDDGLLKSVNWCSGCSDELPTGPIKWIYDKKNGYTMLAVGSSKGQQRHEALAYIPTKEK
ncbi:SEC14 cytosolic factor [Paramyrothecium foliicola]|nr:SEC14 cytosolic factor [Paramyrothecium foliicola]